jgi:lipopolysaccharide transport system ATP-binding protein
MSALAIRAEGLGKKYLIGHQASNERYVTLRDVLARTAKGFVRSARDMARGRQLVDGDEIEEFWALKDVNFEIKRGEVVGIIGRNGAGKSTLLKILSRITEPSTGRVEIRGRVASLLEVGTGFHPELTGRENIYLNGAILSMPRAEIRRKFDEIVAFAEVEKFLDTPVKRYSSGMYVRLAFAVAAHLEPEILVVDEVLAVGDTEFQRKCLGKMDEIGKGGRTILFVSHNMQAVRRFCSRCIVLSAGRLAREGATDPTLRFYLEQLRPQENATEARLREIVGELPPDPACLLLSIGLRQDGAFPVRVESAKPLELVLEYDVLEETYGLHVYFRLVDDDETLLFESIDIAENEELLHTSPGRYQAKATIPANFLGGRRYELQVGVAIARGRHCLPNLVRIPFEVDLTGRINQAFPGYISPGRLLPSIRWSTARIGTSMRSPHREAV